MKRIGEIISEELFLNAFRICQNYCKTKQIILDVNFRLVKKQLLLLSEYSVRKFYKNYIANDLVYTMPELFSSDVVSIPKKLTGVREYRFFSSMSMVLYNAIGLLFVDCCSNVIDQLDFKRKNVFAFYPTKFVRQDGGWEARNDYKTEYHAFADRLNNQTQAGDVVLKIDISGYFESISHAHLARQIRDFSPESSLEKHNISKDAFNALEFYFESMMRKKQGIPQGRKNFVSDFFGYLYLMPFDIQISSLANSRNLKFKSVVRYVDDIYLILSATPNLPQKDIYRELLSLEQAISGWLYAKLNLSVSPEKTERKIIRTLMQKAEFIKSAKKAISSPVKPEGSEASTTPVSGVGDDMEERFKLFKEAVEKFRFADAGPFKFLLTTKDREDLKVIFYKSFQAFIFKGQNIATLKSILLKIEFDLTADQINILIMLFFLERKGSKPFYPIIENFLNNLINLNDKRHVHIMFAVLAQDVSLGNFKKVIKRYFKELCSDNYGKYLLCFFDMPDKENKNSIYKRISREYAGEKTKKGTSLFSPFGDYECFIVHIFQNYPDKQALIQNLKRYIYEKWNRRWDLAFNFLHNSFHELCKLKFALDDKASVKEVLKKLNDIEIEDELLIMKFYDRRNFNAVSHPSQKGKPSVKVSKLDFLDYEKSVLKFISGHLLHL